VFGRVVKLAGHRFGLAVDAQFNRDVAAEGQHDIARAVAVLVGDHVEFTLLSLDVYKFFVEIDYDLVFAYARFDLIRYSSTGSLFGSGIRSSIGKGPGSPFGMVGYTLLPRG